jgi:hemolysin activation/secretion protein
MRIGSSEKTLIFKKTLALLVALCFINGEVFAQGETERFDINRFEVVGNSLLNPAEVEAAVSPFAGVKRDYGDVQGALEALELLYRGKGYSAVQVIVPEQELDRGIVKLQVVEAKVGSLKIEGNLEFDDANIRRSLPALRPGTSPNTSEIAANVQLANENPAKQVDVVLHVAEQEGLIDAEVSVAETPPRKLFVTMDNTGNDSTGNYRLGVGFQDANVFGKDHVFSASYITAPEKSNKVEVFSLSYRIPLYQLGDSIDLIIAKSDVNAGTAQTVAGPLQFSGRGDIYGLRYNQLLKRRGELSHRIVYGLDQKEFDNACSLGDFGAAGCGAAANSVTTRPFTLTYSGNLQRPGLISDFFVTYAQNIPGTGRGKAEDFAAVRPSPAGGAGATANFKAVRFGGSITHAYASDWQSRVALSAQYSGDSLVPGEQFGIAGSTAVRGFMEREVARDKGWFSNIELISPNYGSRLGLGNTHNLRGMLFYDFGAASNNTLPGELKQHASIASAGVGLRWGFEKNFNLRFDLGRVLDEGGNRHKGDYRGHVAVYYGF